MNAHGGTGAPNYGKYPVADLLFINEVIPEWKRDWMDDTTSKFAYRCLPLNIANSHGWEIASPCGFEVEWDGDPNVRGITIRALDGYPDASNRLRSASTS